MRKRELSFSQREKSSRCLEKGPIFPEGVKGDQGIPAHGDGGRQLSAFQEREELPRLGLWVSLGCQCCHRKTLNIFVLVYVRCSTCYTHPPHWCSQNTSKWGHRLKGSDSHSCSQQIFLKHLLCAGLQRLAAEHGACLLGVGR